MGNEIDVPIEEQIKYLRRRLVELRDIESELNVGTFDLAKRVGHQIRGNAATFKFKELEEFGARLEIAANSESTELVRKELISLTASIQKLFNALIG